MVIDKPMQNVWIRGQDFNHETLEIINVPESASARVSGCHFIWQGDGPALKIHAMGSYRGRFLFPYPPETFIQDCLFEQK